MKDIVQVFRKVDSTKQIVMFPFGGGSGYSYSQLIGNIPRDIEIIVINPPGRLFNEGNPLETIDAKVNLYSKGLRPLLKENTLFFGHSIGGLVAYEICKNPENQIPIKKMVISSINPPHCTRDHVDLESDMDKETLVRKSTELGGMPHIFEQEPQLLEFFIDGLRSDLKALESYRHPKLEDARKLDINTVVLYGDSDYIVTSEKLRQWEYYLDCSRFIELPGDHFYLFEETNRKAVAQVLTDHVNN